MSARVTDLLEFSEIMKLVRLRLQGMTYKELAEKFNLKNASEARREYLHAINYMIEHSENLKIAMVVASLTWGAKELKIDAKYRNK